MLNANETLCQWLPLINRTVLDIIAESDHRTYGMLEDLVQDACLHLLEYAFVVAEKVTPALIKCAVKHHTLNTLRLAYERKSDFMGDDMETLLGVEDGPEASTMATQEAARLAHAIASLDAGDQLLVGLISGGMSQRDAGKALNATPVQVTRRKQRLLAKLAERLPQ